MKLTYLRLCQTSKALTACKRSLSCVCSNAGNIFGRVPIEQHWYQIASNRFWIHQILTVFLVAFPLSNHAFLKDSIKVQNFQTFKVHTISSNLLLTFSILFPGPDSLQRPAKRRIWWNSTQLYMLTTLLVFPFYENSCFASLILPGEHQGNPRKRLNNHDEQRLVGRYIGKKYKVSDF